MSRPARPVWEHDCTRVVDGTVGDIRMLLLTIVGRHRVAVLGEEEARALRDVLTAWLDDGGHLPPANPCAIRSAVQRQQRALLVRDLTGSDATTEAAWAQSALAEIARAAGAR